MKREDQVCSLELAKKLKDLGVKQDSLFAWYRNTYKNSNKEFKLIGKDYDIAVNNSRVPTFSIEHTEFYSAFTVAELGDLLPGYVYSQKVTAFGSNYLCADISNHVNKPEGFSKMIEGDTEAKVRAEMRIYLLINNINK